MTYPPWAAQKDHTCRQVLSDHHSVMSRTACHPIWNDTYIVDNASEHLTEGASAGKDTVMSSVAWTLATDFENLTLTGGDEGVEVV